MDITLKKLKIALFSDLHAGDNTSADNFGVIHSRGVINKIIELESQGFTIIFIGDTLEALQFSYSKIIKTYPNLIEILKRNFVIVGNHDKKIAKALGINAVDELVINNEIFIFHGHIFDKPINPYLVKLVLKIWAVIERLIGRKASSDVDSKISPMDKKYNGNIYNDYVKKAYQIGIARGLKLILMGHTHLEGIWDFGDAKVINVGKCIDNHIMFATVEEDSNKKLLTYLHIDNKVIREII